MMSRPASTPSVLYHRGALLLAVVVGDARHHATRGHFHGADVRSPAAPPSLRAATPPLPSRSAESRKVHIGLADLWRPCIPSGGPASPTPRNPHPTDRMYGPVSPDV